MTPSQACLSLIRAHEGLRLKAYLCPAGKWTIGYGHTRGVRPGDTCTKEEAEVMLVADAGEAGEAVEALVSPSLTQPQFDALVSWVFNLGPVKFRSSTLRAKLEDNDFVGAALEFGKWVYGTNPKTGKKEKLNGLILRREDERKLFETEEITTCQTRHG